MQAMERPNNACRRTATRLAALTVLAAVAVMGLAACGGSGSPHVVSLGTTTGKTVNSTTTSSSGGSTTSSSKGANPTKLVDQWATCMRQHGDPTQADPVIDSHGVINIIVPPVTGGGPPVVTGGPETAKGTCSQYLAAAQRILRAAPVSPPPNRSELFSYVNCMRANGVPNYPYPTGEKANFNGTGVDPNSPQFERANKVCGDKLNLPAWWVNGWGPPGDVSVRSALVAGIPHGPAVPAGSNGAGSGG
jgi:hypothetical protein